MLVARQWKVVELFEGPINMAMHGNINVALIVRPIEGEAPVSRAGPINCEFVMGFDDVNEVLSVGLGKVFHTKVVNTEDEGCFLGVVAPKAWGEWRWLVAGGYQLCYQLVESDDGRFLEAVHTVPNLEIHIAVFVDLDVVLCEKGDTIVVAELTD
jgi:hypothetical protein